MNKFLKNAILYEIYPSSFYDSNGDGIGDLAGITEKLEYVKSLGVNLIWINPFFLSPFRDGGYDISDYYKVDPRFGTTQDFEMLVKKCKKLKIKIIIDLVIGHTSIEHPWFKESAKKERNKYSDYYIWTDSVFASYKDKTIQGMYDRDGGYVINYYACQPALNYGFLDMGYPNNNELNQNWKIHYLDKRLEPLRNEIIKIMKFWMDKGIDGFRVDLASSLVKKDYGDFRDEEEERIKGIKWLWKKLMEGIKKYYPDTIFLAEWVCPKVSVGKCGFDFDYIAHDCEPYNTLFRYEKDTNILPIFEKGKNYFSHEGKGDISRFIAYVQEVLSAIEGKGYFSCPTGYHDIVRIANGVKDNEVMKTVFAFILTFKNVPFVYYGDEIGIKHNYGLRKDGGGIRTGCRTPMQWNNDKNRGFSTSDFPYLPTNKDKGISVFEQENDPNSLLNAFKLLTKLRNRYSFLNAAADLEIIEAGYPLVYRRKDKSGSAIIAINPSDNNYFKKIKYNEVLLTKNAEINGRNIELKAQSYVVLKE